MNEVLDYLFSNWLEITAAALGIIAVFLQIRINSFYWIVSIANVLLYIGVYMTQRLYALALLMVYYVIMSAYGWYYWRYGSKNGDVSQEYRITTTRLSTWIWIIVTMFVLFMLIAWVLYRFTDSTWPLLDGLVTTLSFSATWMLARKKIENWILWLITNVISCYLYLNQAMYPTLGLYAFLSVMAVIGYFSWKNKMKLAHA